MKQNSVGEMIFNEDDVCDLLMKGRTVESLRNMIVDDTVNLERAVTVLQYVPPFIKSHFNPESIHEYHKTAQNTWHMPQHYQDLDIAEYVLNLCSNEAELQRCGHELMLYQERNLFNLLRYLKYLVDVMTEHQIIWGVGRGSSVASFVLYKLGVHKINSMFYELNVEEFLR
jgi:hypothetical protein